MHAHMGDFLNAFLNFYDATVQKYNGVYTSLSISSESDIFSIVMQSLLSIILFEPSLVKTLMLSVL